MQRRVRRYQKNRQHNGCIDKTYIYKQDDFTLKYKRYATPRMSPTGTNKTNKGLHITSGMPSRVWAPQG
jgi:hypothetical protein